MQQITRRNFMLTGAAVGASIGLGAFSSTAMAASEFLKGRSTTTRSKLVNFVEFSNEIYPNSAGERWTFAWEIAEDEYFNNIVSSDQISFLSPDKEALTIRLENVPAGKKLFYRVKCDKCLAYENNGVRDVFKEKTLTIQPQTEISSRYVDSTGTASIEQWY